MKKNTFFSILVILTLITISGYTDETEEGFLFQLKFSLKAQGWSEEELAPFMNAAQHMNWQSLENENCEIVAYSLQYCKRSGQETEPGEKAQMAYNLAVTGSEMRSMGFDEDKITRVSVNSAREIMATLNQYRKKGSDQGMGDMIRQRIQEQLCDEGLEQQQEKLMKRIRERTQSHLNDGQGPQNQGLGNGPPH